MGRWYFDIDRTGGRSTKTASSIRHVPLHRELKRIGLLKYRESLLKAVPAWKTHFRLGLTLKGSEQSRRHGRSGLAAIFAQRAA
jgi:hypothetical protein